MVLNPVESQPQDGDGDLTLEQEEQLEPEARTLYYQKKKMREQRDEARKQAEEASNRAKELEDRLNDVQWSAEGKLKELTEEQELIKFTIQHRELNADALLELKDIAKSKGLTLDQAYDTPLFKAYADSLKGSEDDSATIPSFVRSPKVNPEKPFNEMSREEHKKYLSEKFGIL